MAQSKSVSSWRLMTIEHGRQRRDFEELMRAERDQLLLRHKEELVTLKKSHDKALDELKRRLLAEENSERENRNLPKKTPKRKRDAEQAPIENIPNIVRSILYLFYSSRAFLILFVLTGAIYSEANL
jgi:hypothetical protein